VIGRRRDDDDQGDEGGHPSLPFSGPPIWQRMPGAGPPSPAERRDEGTERAASRWTAAEEGRVDDAIARAARELPTFTADDVWERCPGVPVTKGLAGRLLAAARAGTIENTGATTTAQRGGQHDHAQRLSVWRAKG
jgi:hypothetical protein